MKFRERAAHCRTSAREKPEPLASCYTELAALYDQIANAEEAFAKHKPRPLPPRRDWIRSGKHIAARIFAKLWLG